MLNSGRGLGLLRQRTSQRVFWYYPLWCVVSYLSQRDLCNQSEPRNLLQSLYVCAVLLIDSAYNGIKSSFTYMPSVSPYPSVTILSISYKGKLA